ncbi:hypothetical protein ACFFGH_06525 [Lysobacter korlensis]|uniref:J domain-containing protein n=1 Tax=Lysobacter korlensis TaxID=553636 RepID=A0ABV6RKJ0_9GAMM
MRTEGRQPDLIRNSPPELAKAYRVAADTVRRDPHWAPSDAEKRARLYEREAERLEQRA